MTRPKPTLLCILDGIGLAPPGEHNAVDQAETPVLDQLLADCPHARLLTHGAHVGLPEGQMGNSEVGHMTIGAGRVIFQSLERINRDIASGTFAHQPGFSAFVDAAKTARAIHVIGLVSEGGVHSHMRHALAVCQALDGLGKPVNLHALTDGRDADPRAAKPLMRQVQAELAKMNQARLATICGRFYVMDRDQRWQRIEQGWKLYSRGEGTVFANTDTLFETHYAAGVTDEFIPPSLLPAGQEDSAQIRDGDAVFLFNFRADRMRQLSRVLLGMDGVDFAYSPPKLAALGSMTLYDALFEGRMSVAYPPEDVHDTLGEIMQAAGLRQLRIAETEKYPHVTYYLNAGREEPFTGEDRILVPSPREVRSYDQKPEMSLPEVTERLIAAIGEGRYDFIALNIANGDMVGHCGNRAASLAAVQHVDAALGRILAAIQAQGGQTLVIADHGNIEEMRVDGRISTAHSTNPVPIIYVGAQKLSLRDGGLADVAPTLLQLMDLPQPPAMTGRSLIR